MVDLKTITRRSVLAASALAVTESVIAQNTDKTDTAHILARNKLQARRYNDEIFNKRDLSNAHEFLSPQLTINGRKLKNGYSVYYQNILRFLETQFDKLVIVIDDIIAEGNTVAIRSTGTCVYYPGGRTDQDANGVPIETKAMSFYEFDEKGLMVSNIHIQDDSQIKAADKEYKTRQNEG